MFSQLLGQIPHFSRDAPKNTFLDFQDDPPLTQERKGYKTDLTCAEIFWIRPFFGFSCLCCSPPHSASKWKGPGLGVCEWKRDQDTRLRVHETATLEEYRMHDTKKGSINNAEKGERHVSDEFIIAPVQIQ